jgi:crotonobetainyl-CoA:carnitine CoA-transferase CaiB-like acyl-CoA transferase
VQAWRPQRLRLPADQPRQPGALDTPVEVDRARGSDRRACYDTPDARLRCEAEVDEIVTGWTRERTKHEAMAQLSSVGVPAGAVLDSMELTNEPSFPQRGIPQTMTHGEERPFTVRPALQIPEIRRFRLQCSAARRCRRRLADQHARREFRRRQRRSCLRHGTFQPSRDGSV